MSLQQIRAEWEALARVLAAKMCPDPADLDYLEIAKTMPAAELDEECAAILEKHGALVDTHWREFLNLQAPALVFSGALFGRAFTVKALTIPHSGVVPPGTFRALSRPHAKRFYDLAVRAFAELHGLPQ